MAYLSPFGNSQQSDANGDPLVGGKVWTYVGGTVNTPATTYTAEDGITPQANPIILNARGIPANPIWLQGGQSYKLVVTDANDVVLQTVDDIQGINDPSVSATQDQWVTFSGTPTYLSATTFSVPGDQTPALQVARRLKTSNAGGVVYSTIVESSFGAGITTVRVINDSGTLDAGLTGVSYGLLSATGRSIPTIGAPYFGQCQLTKSGANLLLSPFNGNQLTIGGVNYAVPSGGITLAPSGLVADTVYWIYAYMSSGVMTLEASTTARATDTSNGMQIKNGDATRTLVGFARTDGATAWADTEVARHVRSWFNRQRQLFAGAITTTRTTTSTSLTEINTETRAFFLCWSDDVLTCSSTGWMFNSSTNENYMCVGVDGASTRTRTITTRDTNGGPAVATGTISGLSEGNHYIALIGAVSAGTGSWVTASGARDAVRIEGWLAQ